MDGVFCLLVDPCVSGIDMMKATYLGARCHCDRICRVQRSTVPQPTFLPLSTGRTITTRKAEKYEHNAIREDLIRPHKAVRAI